MLIQHKPLFDYSGRLSGFLPLIAALIRVLWFIDQLWLVAFIYLPFRYRCSSLVGLLLIIRFA